MSITSSPKNKLVQTLQNTKSEAGQPADQQERISYGEIVSVNPENSQVRVKMYTSPERGGSELVMDGKPVPVIQPLSVIHQCYGTLSPGMKVRIYWTGKNKPKDALVEVIGDADFDLLRTINKEPEDNRVDTQPYMVLSGGTQLV